MIWKTLVAGAVLAGTATMAFAADLPSKEKEPDFEPPPPMPVFSWTGAYFGAHAGYGFGRDAATLRVSSSGASSSLSHPNGVLGGLHGGVNYALLPIGRTTLVTGVEADIDGADDSHASVLGAASAGVATKIQSDIKSSIRARLGVADRRVLYFATGGVTFADFDTRYVASPGGAAAFTSVERVRPGYALGGGVEYAFMNHVTVRAEYRYSDYGTFVDPLGTTTPGVGASVSRRESDNRLQAGLSYKFNEIVPRSTAGSY